MLHRILILIAILPAFLFAAIDSLFEQIMRPLDLLPNYYLRFNLSTFALHQDAFFKRQYLAEPHPDLEFRLLSYKDFISSVWNVDFQFGLGEVPGNTVFTVLNVAFGIDPQFEFKLRRHLISTGLAHHCYHEVDKSYFPLIHNNRIHAAVATHNIRLNDYYKGLYTDSLFLSQRRYAWEVEAGYYLKEFFGLVGPGKLNGNSPLITELVTSGRCAFYQRRSWIFSFRGENTLGLFDTDYGYHVKGGSNLYWKLAIGLDAFFVRGLQGGSFYLLYHLDDLPVPENTPDFTLGNSRFSKNGLIEIGVVFFN